MGGLREQGRANKMRTGLDGVDGVDGVDGERVDDAVGRDDGGSSDGMRC